jgi:hypothetical protein
MQLSEIYSFGHRYRCSIKALTGYTIHRNITSRILIKTAALQNEYYYKTATKQPLLQKRCIKNSLLNSKYKTITKNSMAENDCKNGNPEAIRKAAEKPQLKKKFENKNRLKIFPKI